jgi:hypothetical protein
MSVHAGIEEVAFYSTVREALPNVDDDIDEYLEEHREAKQNLATRQGEDPGSPDFDGHSGS